MTKYEKMTDAEIAEAVLLADGYIIESQDFLTKSKCFIKDKRLKYICDDILICFNPCNNPEDAWPIILENGIGICAEDGKLVAATNNTHEYYEPFGSTVFKCDHKNPLRAAMIVFLMMRENENAG